MVNTSLLNASNALAAIEGDFARVSYPCKHLWYILYGLSSSFSGLGILGNIISFIVLHKSANNVANYLLKSLAIADSLYLIGAFIVPSYGVWLISIGENLLSRSRYYRDLLTYCWPLVNMFQMTSVWMTVLIAGNRYIAVCKPLHATYLCTTGRVRLEMWLMIFLIMIYNIPVFFEYRYDDVFNTTKNSTKTINVGLISNHLYLLLYWGIANCVFFFFLPLSILIFLNAHLICALKNANQQRQQISNSFPHEDSCTGSSTITFSLIDQLPRGSTATETTRAQSQSMIRVNRSATSSDENDITLVMIIVVLVFIVCETPAAVNYAFLSYYMFKDIPLFESDECTLYQRFYETAHLLIVFNSSINFIIYCLLRRQFRQRLAELCCFSYRVCTHCSCIPPSP